MLPTFSSPSIISRCTVVPDCRSPSKTIKLPVSDLPIMLSFQNIRKGNLYTKPSFSVDYLLPLLKQALSQTLSHFPHLAGRVTTNSEGFVHIICNDLGVEFIYAKATHVATGNILSPTHSPDSVEEFFLFDGMISYSSHFKPLLAVQVTELADAIFIGCTVNPAVTDGTSFWNFFNSIAGTFLSQLSTERNSKKGQKMADILPITVIRERGDQVKLPPVIPFTFSFVLWAFSLSVSSAIIVLCTTSYLLAKVSSDDNVENPPFSMGILDIRIRTYYCLRSCFAFLIVGHLCFIARTLMNNSKFRFPQTLKDIVIISKPEIEFIVGKIFSIYLSQNTNKEDPLIVVALVGSAIFFSSCLAFITGPEPESLFSIVTTIFSCGISYASSKRLWKIVYSCLACQLCSFLLSLPILFVKKEWVVKILVFVLFYLLFSFLFVGFTI